eukprot:s292_g10.t2
MLPGHYGAVNALAFFRDKTLVSAGADCWVHQYCMQTDTLLARHLAAPPPLSSTVLGVAAAQSMPVAVTMDGEGGLRLWDLKRGSKVGSMACVSPPPPPRKEDDDEQAEVQRIVLKEERGSLRGDETPKLLLHTATGFCVICMAVEQPMEGVDPDMETEDPPPDGPVDDGDDQGDEPEGTLSPSEDGHLFGERAVLVFFDNAHMLKKLFPTLASKAGDKGDITKLYEAISKEDLAKLQPQGPTSTLTKATKLAARRAPPDPAAVRAAKELADRTADGPVVVVAVAVSSGSGAVAALGGPQLALSWQTVVDQQPVQPYIQPENVYVQGVLAQGQLFFTTSTSWQTPDDLLVAVMESETDFYLLPLEDDRTESAHSVPGGNDDNREMITMMVALKEYLQTGEQRPGHLHALLGPVLPRYNINETLWNQRRMRLRHGRHNAACEILPPPPDILEGLSEEDKATRIVNSCSRQEVESDNGLLGAYEVLLEAGVASRQVFQVGAADGKSGDPVYQLIMQRGVGGLGIEALPDDVLRARQNRPPRFRVEQAYITPANVWHWARQLKKIDVVVIDIDTFECPVLEALLDGARALVRVWMDGQTDGLVDGWRAGWLPALLNLEINMLVPPPFKFSRGYGLHDTRPQSD